MIEKTEVLYDGLLKKKRIKCKNCLISTYPMLKSILRKIAKVIIATLLYRLGFFAVIKSNLFNKEKLKVIVFHRIGDNEFDPLSMFVKIKTFDSIMNYITNNYKVISLQDALDLLEKKERFSDNYIAVTFDDGYKDNYVNAFPILKKYNIPATIFLTAAYKNNFNWYDRIVDAFQRTKKTFFKLDELKSEVFLLKTLQDKQDVIRKVVEFAKRIAGLERDKFIDKVITLLDVNQDQIDDSNRLLSKEEILEMNANGVTFGSHGLSHTILTVLSPNDAEREIIDSKNLLSLMTRMNIDLFAYPNGQEGDFNDEILGLLKKYDYRAAFTVLSGGNNSGISFFKLRRYCITGLGVTGLNGKFSKIKFEMHISGVVNLITRFLDKEIKTSLT
jgi:peptidoglycan/xylan/chitin deacetylase (PgdA/CDA1 family)